MAQHVHSNYKVSPQPGRIGISFHLPAGFHPTIVGRAFSIENEGDGIRCYVSIPKSLGSVEINITNSAPEAAYVIPVLLPSEE